MTAQAQPAAHLVRLQDLRQSLRIEDPRARAEAALEALSWNGPDARVEWAPLPQDIGRFTVGSFPTGASVVAGDEPARTAWHAGFRWCLSVQRDALEWYDLRHGDYWRGDGEALDARTLDGLTARSFARTGRLQPNDVHFLAAPADFRKDPSDRVAEKIKQWWETSCQRHLTETSSQHEQERHKDQFTRFVAGILLLRTVEDMDRVPWLPRGRLHEAVRGKAPAHGLGELVSFAAARLNSRVLSRIAKDLGIDVRRTIIEESYEMNIDFAKLDVDPVGAFYEEILGVDYVHKAVIQRRLFDSDLQTSEIRNARRNQGVYYTPRIYADTLARKLVRPAIRAAESSSELPVIADIAAGSGELLCAALREILSEPAWNDPMIALDVLDHRLYAVDKNPLALQLCALNLLRTAIRYVPEILDVLNEKRRFPPLEDNLRQGDALLRTTIDELPTPDIVLINPPFHAPNRWSRPAPDEALPELYEVDSHPNKALAFFAAAVRLARPGAGLGIIMPSALFRGPDSGLWRQWLAQRVSLDLVVANYGETLFKGVYSYAGLVVGQKQASSEQWRRRTRIVEIRGGIDHERDTGTLLSDRGDEPEVVARIDPEARTWLGHVPEERAPRSATKLPWRPLCEVMGDQFHQGIILAPKPWGRELFLFERSENGMLKHCRTGKNLGRLTSPTLRPFVNAKKASAKIPLWCEPAVGLLWVFVPPCGGTEWSSIDDIDEHDIDGRKLARAVCRAILDQEPPEGSAALVAHARRGELRFWAPKGFRNVGLPLVYASKATVTAKSRDENRTWYSWINLTGDAIPVSGLQLRARSAAFAAALAAWMSIEETVAPLVAGGANRRGGSMELNLTQVAQWPVPDLREDRMQTRLDELESAFLAYREEASMHTPKEALRLRSYREAQQAALALWDA